MVHPENLGAPYVCAFCHEAVLAYRSQSMCDGCRASDRAVKIRMWWAHLGAYPDVRNEAIA
ncbi:MAG TPA: hypothetical protein VEA38_09400, partial [Terriglobales bacterium]|nr:hypothetical protein [Terriglobales bacterium]